jgi:hypothetical protein
MKGDNLLQESDTGGNDDRARVPMTSDRFLYRMGPILRSNQPSSSRSEWRNLRSSQCGAGPFQYSPRGVHKCRGPSGSGLARHLCRLPLQSRERGRAIYTRLVPLQPNRLLSQWRMRFLEAKFGQQCGASPFAPGHAVLFRREALKAVGGYDVRYRLHHEDSDICLRMKREGWETHYVATSRCVSIQEDSMKQLALKELRESYWYSPAQSSLIHLYLHLRKWTLIRAGRNLVKGRWNLLPLDAAIWACALWMATIRTVRHLLRSNREIAKQAPG